MQIHEKVSGLNGDMNPRPRVPLNRLTYVPKSDTYRVSSAVCRKTTSDCNSRVLFSQQKRRLKHLFNAEVCEMPTRTALKNR